MGPVIKKFCSVIIFIVIPLFMIGCSSSGKGNEASVKGETEAINILNGAVLKSEDGDYNIYNLKNGNYNKADIKDVVLSYNKKSSNYIGIDNGRYYFVSKGNKNYIDENNCSKLKLSSEGNNISYFIEDNGLKLKVFDVHSNEKIDINSNVSISGTLYDWYDDNTLVYYGVSDDGVNGLFTYDVKTGDEELLYKIEQGYLAYLKGNDDDVLFLQIDYDNSRKIMCIDKETKNVKILTDKIEKLNNIIQADGNTYVLGKAYGDVDSLYQIGNANVKRLVYDFPQTVEVENGLTTDGDNDVLFLGSSLKDEGREQIFKYSKDGTIEVLGDKASDYMFIEMN